MNLKFEPPQKKVSPLAIFYRLTRAQFLPLIIFPVLVGTALAYYDGKVLNIGFFVAALLGSVLLHLGANSIDDCYDFQNGVDGVANSMFPKDFRGWKPLPRGLISLTNAKVISYSLYAASISFGIYLSFKVGIFAIVLGAIGIFLAHFYSAPPLKLDYRGKALGETAIFFAFGPIPILGAFYVQSGILSLNAFLVAIPVGLMTVTILMNHDLIFYEVYQSSRKLSLTTVLGRKSALNYSLGLTIVSYACVAALILGKVLPIYSMLAPLLSAIVLARNRDGFSKSSEPPPYYVPFTINALLSNWLFMTVLVASLLI